MLAVFLLGWLPVFLLEILGHRFDIRPELSFLHDYAAITYMAAIPFLVITRRVFSGEWTFVCRNAFSSGLLSPEKSASLKKLLTHRIETFDSRSFYLGLIATGLALSLTILLLTLKDGSAFWFSSSNWPITPAGIYHWAFNVPVFLSILLYWASRYWIWFCFLRDFARQEPAIHASHPDRTGGLGFLGDATTGLSLLMFTIGAVLSATVLYKVNVEGVAATSAPVLFILGGYTIAAVCLITGPLLVFTGPLFRARKIAIFDLTRFGLKYADLLDEKPAGSQESLGMLQAQADLSVVFQNIHRMRIWPIDLGSLGKFILTAILPLLPLLYELLR